jgi:hypothetical protein
MRPILASVVALLGLLTGCADDLPQATEIVHTRVLGARVEVRDDPERATPAPGEKIDVAYQVIFPEFDQDSSSLRSLLINCTLPVRFTGIPLCKEVTDFAMQGGVSLDDLTGDLERFYCDEDDATRLGTLGVTCVSGPPVLSVSVPAGFPDEALLLRGVICEHGTPFIDPTTTALFGCEPDDPDAPGETMLVHGSVPVELTPEARNLNPSFDDYQVELNGRAWPAFEGAALPAEDDCAESANSSDLPLIDPFEHRPGITVDPEVREVFDDVPEDLEFSFFVTDGALDARFVVFEGEDDVPDEGLTGSVLWDAPGRDEVSKRGQLARIIVTVLDRRGGYDLTERFACLYDCLEGEVDAPLGCN